MQLFSPCAKLYEMMRSPSPKSLSSKQWGWKPKVNGEGCAPSEVGRRPCQQGPCALPAALWIAILVGKHPWHQVPQPPSLNLPGLFSHLSPSVERPSSNLAVPRLLFAAKSRKWPSRLDVLRALIKVKPRGGEFYLCEVPEMFPKAEVPHHPLLISSKSNWKVPRKPLGKILTNVPQSGNSGKVRQAGTSRLLVYMLSWLFTTDSFKLFHKTHLLSLLSRHSSYMNTIKPWELSSSWAQTD